MTNRQAGHIAALFCAMGLLSAGALAYELNRPLTVRPRLEVPRMVQRATDLRVAEVPDLEPTVYTLAPIVIQATPRATPKPTLPEVPRDFTECSDWLPLEQGLTTQRVRICH